MYQIRFATSDDLEAIFRARHRIYVETDGFLQASSDGRITDRFDRLTATRHIVAEAAAQIIGGIRLTVWTSQDGLPALDYFDFRPYLPTLSDRIANGSLIFVDKSWRKAGVGQSLMIRWCAELLKLACTHAIGVLNPPLLPWFIEHGFQAVGHSLQDEITGVPFVPVVLELGQLNPEIEKAARSLEGLATERV